MRSSAHDTLHFRLSRQSALLTLLAFLCASFAHATPPMCCEATTERAELDDFCCCPVTFSVAEVTPSGPAPSEADYPDCCVARNLNSTAVTAPVRSQLAAPPDTDSMPVLVEYARGVTQPMASLFAVARTVSSLASPTLRLAQQVFLC